MLQGTLFTIISLEHDAGIINTEIKLDKDNEIFSGHFPGQPVLPGACMLQILKEIIEAAFDSCVRLKKADQMKFLRMVDPGANDILLLKISYVVKTGDIDLNATVNIGDELCFKFKGTFIQRNP